MNESDSEPRETSEIKIDSNSETHNNRLQEILLTQWQNGQFCDLHVKLTDGTIDVHACVFFGFCQNLIDLIGVDCFDATSKEINLERHRITEAGIRPIVHYLYTGRLVLKTDQNALQEVNKTALLFGLTDIETVCQKHLKDNIDWDLNVEFENGEEEMTAIISRKRGRPKKKSSPKKMKKEECLQNENLGQNECNNSNNLNDTTTEIKKEKLSHDESEEGPPPSEQKRRTRSSTQDTTEHIKSMLKVEEEFLNFDQVDDLECYENEFKCFNCLKTFESISEIESHLRTCTVSKDRIECDICGRVFARKCNMTVHKRRVHTGRNYLQCLECGLKPSSENELRVHCKQEHNILKPFQCDFPGCDYRARKYEFVSRHKQIHQELFDHICENCGRAFAQIGGLISHRRACYGSQGYLCDICGKAFNHPQSMKTHRRAKHFNEKPFHCAICNSRFSDHRNFKRHKRIHENAYPYCCEACGKRYRHSNSLKAHMVKHIEAPYKETTDKHFKSTGFYSDEVDAAAASLMFTELPAQDIGLECSRNSVSSTISSVTTTCSMGVSLNASPTIEVLSNQT